MGDVIKRFADGSFIEYDWGGFDKWCVYYTEVSGRRKPPRDVEYFEQLKCLAQKYGVDRVYRDFVKVYDWTEYEVDENTLVDITRLSDTYGEDAVAVDALFSILYLAMLAEQNKENTKLGKKIKRLGVHLLLLENEPVDRAANVMRGQRWFKIRDDCRERGF